VDELEALERDRKLALLRLRGLCDQLREFEQGIVKWEAVLNDPEQKERNALALRALDVARRGKATVDKAIDWSLQASHFIDKKEEVLKQLAALDDEGSP